MKRIGIFLLVAIAIAVSHEFCPGSESFFIG